ncbi:MAG: hypothetical protein V1792_14890 [Pseudomonadota bacterium]
MLRFVRVLEMIVGVAVTVIFSISCSFANDVPSPLAAVPIYKAIMIAWTDNFDIVVVLFLSSFLTTVIVEYFVIVCFLRHENKARLEILFWVFSINVLTNPASQLAALTLTLHALNTGSETIAWGMLCVVELVAIAVECVLMLWALRRLYYGGIMSEPVTVKRTISMVVTANVLSFSFGWIAKLFWLSPPA